MKTPMRATATVTDPVCGMTIDPATAVASSVYNGATYHFCSRSCEKKFSVAPAEYVAAWSVPVKAGSCLLDWGLLLLTAKERSRWDNARR